MQCADVDTCPKLRCINDESRFFSFCSDENSVFKSTNWYLAILSEMKQKFQKDYHDYSKRCIQGL